MLDCAVSNQQELGTSFSGAPSQCESRLELDPSGTCLRLGNRMKEDHCPRKSWWSGRGDGGDTGKVPAQRPAFMKCGWIDPPNLFSCPSPVDSHLTPQHFFLTLPLALVSSPHGILLPDEPSLNTTLIMSPFCSKTYHVLVSHLISSAFRAQYNPAPLSTHPHFQLR